MTTQADQELAAAMVQFVNAFNAVKPIYLVLHCPRCGVQHIDKADPAIGWTNPPHRSHRCTKCECIWRPADVHTQGVRAIATAGKGDNYISSTMVEAARPNMVTHEASDGKLYVHGVRSIDVCPACDSSHTVEHHRV